MCSARHIRKFFWTPKGLLIIVLAILLAVALPGQGIRVAARGPLTAVLVAAAIDAVVLRKKRGRWEFPSGAILTALLVAMVLSAQASWYVVAITSAFAVVSKYIFRTRATNIFNPAALAIVVTFPVFRTGESWWGALPDVLPVGQVLLLATGIFIADRVNKLPLVLSFLGIYYLLFTVSAFAGDPGWVSEVFRTPDLQAALFFAFFILTDPPTSPVKYPDQIICGAIVAAVSYAIFEWIGVVYYLLIGVLAGNIWEAWRRANRRTGNTFPRGIGTFLGEITYWRKSALSSRQQSRLRTDH